MNNNRAEVCRGSSEAAIACSGLSKRIGRSEVIRRIDLLVPPGTVFGLLGPNGAGKTTLLRLLMGILRPSAGHARVLDHDSVAEGDELRRLVGYVPEKHFIYPWMSVKRVIEFTRALYPAWNTELERGLQDQFQLPNGKLVRQLSHGMLAKLALLLALSHEPRALLLDEPTSGLDPLAREDFIENMAATVATCGQTVLISSHVVSDIERVAGVIGILHAGRMLLMEGAAALCHGAKRVRVRAAQGAPPQVGEAGVLRCRRDNDDFVITFVDRPHGNSQRFGGSQCWERGSEEGIGLEELFKDAIKGKQECGQ